MIQYYSLILDVHKIWIDLMDVILGQYGKSSNGTCVPCLSSCKHCDAIAPTKCTSCQEGKFLHLHQCLSAEQCPTGTFPNVTSWICENCPVGCASCSHSSGLECQSCSEGFVSYKSQCLIRCPEGTFPRNSRLGLTSNVLGKSLIFKRFCNRKSIAEQADSCDLQ